MHQNLPNRLLVHAAALVCSAWVAAGIATERSNEVGGVSLSSTSWVEPPSTPSPFALWDEVSAEQEAESEGEHHPAGRRTTEPHPPSAPSFLLVLLGNATVARQRRRDFAKYVRVNLASRLSLEYDDVGIAGVSEAPPALVVNVTLRPEGGRAADQALLRMAQTNATLLELSGEEYRVARVITPTSILTPKIDTEGSTAALRHEEVEKGVFAAAGAAVALLLLAAALGAVARLRRCGSTKPPESPLPPPPPPPPLRTRRRPLAPPKVIYTGAFALTLGAGRGNTRMGPGTCAIHSRVPIVPTMVGKRVGDRALEAPKGRLWEDRPGRRNNSQRHLYTSMPNHCSFENPNFEK